MQLRCFTLDIDAAHKVAHLRLARPAALNTLDPLWWAELEAVLDRLHRGNEARALVVSSTGKHFSAGMALEVFGGAITLDDAHAEGRAAIFDQLRDLQRAFDKLDALRIPSIVAIHGGCIGGAVDFVCAADIRIASQDAFFCVQEINIGMAADVGTLQRLPKLIPLGLAKELAYTGRRMDAARALACGLVNELQPSAEAATEAALACAREIAAKAPVAVWGTKQALNYARDHAVADGLQQMGWLQGAIWSTDNVRAAVGALKTRQPAHFPELAVLRDFGAPPPPAASAATEERADAVQPQQAASGGAERHEQ
jgi:enoyl-CoA hydratase